MIRRIVLGLGLASIAGAAIAYTFAGNNKTQNDGRPEWPGGTFHWAFNAQTSDALPNVADGSDPRLAIQQAFARWAAESGASSTQDADSANTEASGNDNVNLITFVDTANNRTTVGGALAVTRFFTDNNNNITSSDIVFSPTETWSTTGSPSDAVPISTVATHEIGHWHGLAHSGVVGSSMYPFAQDYSAPANSEMVPESISGDDRAGINLSYPDPVFAAATGTIAGSVTKGGNPVYGAHVVAENVVTGVAQAANITLGANQGAKFGKYEITGLPPGTYRVYAEPLDGPASFSNWQTSTSGGWFLAGQGFGGGNFDTSFLTTFFGSNVVVVAGATQTANITVTSGTPAVNVNNLGLGTMTCPQPGGFSFVTAAPAAVTAGTTVALLVQGLGLADVAATISVSDPTMTLDPTCVRRSGSGSSASVLLRLTTPPTARPGPRTIWVTLPGGEKGACTGCLEVEGAASESGLCSNGIDDDGDGFTDSADIECFQDLCPSDPLKTAPGQCGCGNPDTDTDLDGTANCNDACPSDPAKIAAGQCGCGVADTDSDGDGTANCNDSCPADATKTTPGTCGCGVPETDTDGDGAKDCVETCDNDPLKTSPGTCGCGVPETDTDGDGAKDCVETCDNDPLKTSPGTCGCGVPETDTDGDGVKNCIDNCPATSNADQADANGNGIGDACETLVLRLDHASTTFAAGSADVRMFVDAESSLCLSRAVLDVGFDSGSLGFTGATPATGCSVTLTPLGAGSERIDVQCAPGFDGAGAIATLHFSTPTNGAPAKYLLDASNPEAFDCANTPGALAPTATDGQIVVGCVMGDVFPEGAGNGTVNLQDFVLLRRKALGTIPETAYDDACGDVHPGAVTCARAAGQASSFCITGDSDVRTGDVVVLRRKVSGTYTFDCAACGASLGATAIARRPADVAPGAGDGRLTIADAVRVLRASVGLDALDAESLLRGDVAPASPEPDGALAVRGDGRVDVADAVLVLRASVELARIEWPEREISVVADDEALAPSVAWRAVVEGWPAWAEASGFEGPGCDDVSGLDAAGESWSSICALQGPIAGPHSASWRYRAPEPVDPATLHGWAECVDDALNESTAAIVLVPR